MKTKIAFLLAVLVVGVFLAGCQDTQSSGLASYNQPQGQQPYSGAVGGGCGVAPQSDEIPSGAFDSVATLA